MYVPTVIHISHAQNNKEKQEILYDSFFMWLYSKDSKSKLLFRKSFIVKLLLKVTGKKKTSRAIASIKENLYLRRS